MGAASGPPCPRASGTLRPMTSQTFVQTHDPNNSPDIKIGDQTIWGFMRFRNSPLQTKNHSHVELQHHTIII